MTKPYDPYCERYAEDMEYYDYFWAHSEEELGNYSILERRLKREEYVRTEEGTYNPTNGHFACDSCYIAIGMPSSPTGWVAP